MVLIILNKLKNVFFALTDGGPEQLDSQVAYGMTYNGDDCLKYRGHIYRKVKLPAWMENAKEKVEEWNSMEKLVLSGMEKWTCCYNGEAIKR